MLIDVCLSWCGHRNVEPQHHWTVVDLPNYATGPQIYDAAKEKLHLGAHWVGRNFRFREPCIIARPRR